jgi:hypothetical protein
MSHTKHISEAKHEGTAASGTTAAKASQDSRPAPKSNGRSRGSQDHVAPDATPARPARRVRESRAASSAAPIVELTIDLDDDRVLDAVAQLLLDLVDHEPEAKP